MVCARKLRLAPVFIFPFLTPLPERVFQLEPGKQFKRKMKTGKIRRIFLNQPQERVGLLYIEVTEWKSGLWETSFWEMTFYSVLMFGKRHFWEMTFCPVPILGNAICVLHHCTRIPILLSLGDVTYGGKS